MSSIALLFAVANSLAILALPRRWAPLPLLAGACWVPLTQGFDIGPFTFTVIRVLVAAGVVRIVIRGERISGGLNGLDRILICWAIVACASGLFRDDKVGALVFRLGLVYNSLGIYFLVRVFCSSLEDVSRLCRVTAVLLIPVAIEMWYEKTGAFNLFSLAMGTPEGPRIREESIRAFGPFRHPILAGTVGAVSLPLMLAMFREHRKMASVGLLACVSMIVASASSGPIMTGMAALGSLWMWRFRERMRLLRWVAVLLYVVLDLVMDAPAYFLIARIDVVGGSTGWHRARLMQSAFQHLNEWWLAGTEYTRHWMASGVSWNPNHTDITNYYLHMGVVGGLPMMLLFIAAVAKGFFIVGKRLHSAEQLSEMQQYLLWALGCTLFAHAATFISVSYFDQSSVFVYLTFAALGSAARTGAVPVMAARHEEVAAGPKGRRNTGARPALLPKPAAVAASRYVVNARGARRVKVAHSIKRGD